MDALWLVCDASPRRDVRPRVARVAAFCFCVLAARFAVSVVSWPNDACSVRRVRIRRSQNGPDTLLPYYSRLGHSSCTTLTDRRTTEVSCVTCLDSTHQGAQPINLLLELPITRGERATELAAFIAQRAQFRRSDLLHGYRRITIEHLRRRLHARPMLLVVGMQRAHTFCERRAVALLHPFEDLSSGSQHRGHGCLALRWRRGCHRVGCSYSGGSVTPGT